MVKGMEKDRTGKNTTVINAFAGPGAGKTTSAWIVAAELKKRGFVAEYVSEYPKELVWEGKFELLDGTIEHENAIYMEKKHRIDRLMDKVDFIVTDSPTIQSICFLDDSKVTPAEKEAFTERALDDWTTYQNFNYFVERDASRYEKEGRIHTLEDSQVIDAKIKAFLNDNGIYYGTYSHSNINVMVNNIVKNHNNEKALNKLGREDGHHKEPKKIAEQDKMTPVQKAISRRVQQSTPALAPKKGIEM